MKDSSEDTTRFSRDVRVVNARERGSQATIRKSNDSVTGPPDALYVSYTGVDEEDDSAAREAGAGATPFAVDGAAGGAGEVVPLPLRPHILKQDMACVSVVFGSLCRFRRGCFRFENGKRRYGYDGAVAVTAAVVSVS